MTELWLFCKNTIWARISGHGIFLININLSSSKITNRNKGSEWTENLWDKKSVREKERDSMGKKTVFNDKAVNTWD